MTRHHGKPALSASVIVILGAVLAGCDPEQIVFTSDAGWVTPPTPTRDPSIRAVYADDSCPEGLTACGTRCVDILGDARDCGACGNACTEGQACNAGVCGVRCAPGTAVCRSRGELRCADASRDPRHCGACDNACSADETCEDGACVALFCVPGTVRCATTTATEECDARGERFTETACAAEESCSEGICRPRICTPNEPRCTTGGVGAREVCAEDGLQWNDTPCNAGDSCSGGRCIPQVCSPGTYTCTNIDTRTVCNADGLAASSAPCSGSAPNGYACLGDGVCTERMCIPGANAPTCASPSARQVCAADGQSYVATDCSASESCSGGACLPRICTPGSTRCVPGTLTGRETCNADGLGYSPSPCLDTQSCRSGMCAARICTPGAAACDGTFGTRTCQADGLNYAATMTCPASQSCDPGTGLCAAWTCAPTTPSCVDGANTRRVCNGDGRSYSETPCASNTTCSAGVCVPWICSPGTLSCDGVNTRQRCNPDGLSYSAAPCPGSDPNGYACLGAGACTARMCIPGSNLGTCSSAFSVSVCSADGQSMTAQPCPASESCEGGVCAVRCGDGRIGASESCDDANLIDDDDCRNDCSCSAPLDDCNGLPDGCETSLETSPSHCGGCGMTCDDANPCTVNDCVGMMCTMPVPTPAGSPCGAASAVCDGTGSAVCVPCVDTATGNGRDAGCSESAPICVGTGTLATCRATPIWRFISRNSREIVRGLCTTSTQTADIVCDGSRLGQALHIRSGDVSGYQVLGSAYARASIPTITWEQGASGTMISPSVMRVTGRNSCYDRIAIQVTVLDIYSCE